MVTKLPHLLYISAQYLLTTSGYILTFIWSGSELIWHFIVQEWPHDSILNSQKIGQRNLSAGMWQGLFTLWLQGSSVNTSVGHGYISGSMWHSMVCWWLHGRVLKTLYVHGPQSLKQCLRQTWARSSHSGLKQDLYKFK